ncbi:LysR family transcriptional regulator, partial [Salmonella enterica subsp. enterica serovar Typhimurium]|nr:LysR family transcriptional regulator [Salmonella enterica]MCR2145765.1 LysR family transcriptional regulator [Salmonella enterica]MCR2164204.1 LysR family transcriptional regulator [Salmonella enterica]MCR2178064.1 LysR family transcriptional regulator [Salmonella enterica]
MGSKGANKSFDYNLIKILDAVILSGNAAMAAKKLGITPAAVSLALKRLQSYYPEGNDSNLLIVFYVQIMPDDFVMQLHR